MDDQTPDGFNVGIPTPPPHLGVIKGMGDDTAEPVIIGSPVETPEQRVERLERAMDLLDNAIKTAKVDPVAPRQKRIDINTTPRPLTLAVQIAVVAAFVVVVLAAAIRVAVALWP